MTGQVVLSLFPGADLLGRAFEAEGFCVVRGPDLLWGQDVRDFHVPADRFDGLIGGPPCGNFSKLNRTPDAAAGVAMISEFLRVAGEGRFKWWLMENVPTVPDVPALQRIDVRGTEVGLRQRRIRHFQWWSATGRRLVVPRWVTPTIDVERAAVASEGRRRVTQRRGWPEFCALMGVVPPIDFPGLSKEARYRAVGNGVPVPMGRLLARAIRDCKVSRDVRLCACGCARPVTGKQKCAGVACRKRLERNRGDVAWVTELDWLPPARSHFGGVTGRGTPDVDESSLFPEQCDRPGVSEPGPVTIVRSHEPTTARPGAGQLKPCPRAEFSPEAGGPSYFFERSDPL